MGFFTNNDYSNESLGMWLAKVFKGGAGGDAVFDPNSGLNPLNAPFSSKGKILPGKMNKYIEGLSEDKRDAFMSALDKREALGDLSGDITASQVGRLGLEAAKAHPLKALGLGITGAQNIGGLFDNNKFGGQLGGAGLGYLASKFIGSGSPYGMVMAPLVGGALGAQFDKLRAAREQEQQQMQQKMLR